LRKNSFAPQEKKKGENGIGERRGKKKKERGLQMQRQEVVTGRKREKETRVFWGIKKRKKKRRKEPP